MDPRDHSRYISYRQGIIHISKGTLIKRGDQVCEVPHMIYSLYNDRLDQCFILMFDLILASLGFKHNPLNV